MRLRPKPNDEILFVLLVLVSFDNGDMGEIGDSSICSP